MDARPLYYAAEKGQKGVVELLVANGAVVTARNTRRRETAAEVAKRAGYNEVADLLAAQAGKTP